MTVQPEQAHDCTETLTELDPNGKYGYQKIQRAWIVVKPAAEMGDPPALACNIMNAINHQKIEGNYGDKRNTAEFWSFEGDIRSFAARADIVALETGISDDDVMAEHIVVAVSAIDKAQVRRMAKVIEGHAGSGSVLNIAMVFRHFPLNPYHAQGYIAWQEYNGEPGRQHPNGHSAW